MIYDSSQCSLGEGPLWHPLRGSLFWFDINKKRMYERGPNDRAAQVRQFDEHVSAAGWVDEDTLLIASETSLIRYDLLKNNGSVLVELEADNPITRSNDGRADPFGGFWIGTMGKSSEKGAGAIYRYFEGKLEKLYSDITISNSICFSPDGKTAYFCDTPTEKILQVTLDSQGWPTGESKLFADVAPFNPDGSVVDSEGCLWNAQWGANRVARYDNKGNFLEAKEFPAKQISCPAFGSEDLTTLFATSASDNLETTTPADGQTFMLRQDIRGQQEHQVKLS